MIWFFVKLAVYFSLGKWFWRPWWLIAGIHFFLDAYILFLITFAEPLNFEPILNSRIYSGVGFLWITIYLFNSRLQIEKNYTKIPLGAFAKKTLGLKNRVNVENVRKKFRNLFRAGVIATYLASIIYLSLEFSESIDLRKRDLPPGVESGFVGLCCVGFLFLIFEKHLIFRKIGLWMCVLPVLTLFIYILSHYPLPKL